MTPVAAATVAPIVATNTVPSTTTIGIGFFMVYKVVTNECAPFYLFNVFFWHKYLLILSSSFLGTVPHTQMTSNTIVTMTMASHSSHATAVTTSAIPVGEFVTFVFLVRTLLSASKAGGVGRSGVFNKSFLDVVRS